MESDEAPAVVSPRFEFSSNLPSGPLEELTTIGHIGRYALKYRIGEGSLGAVFAAHDPLLSRLIAIKTLNLGTTASTDASFDAQFLEEARQVAGLSHPYIVPVYDAGIGDQGPYIAMELLKGLDQRHLREQGWRPTPAQAAAIVRRVADALGYAHAKGVLHRDIRPANIFMVGRTQPRLLDFGLARIASLQDALGESGTLVGSPYYMSPEQWDDDKLDRRTDVFSLGVVFYELLTGTKPFKGSTLADIGEAVARHEPRRAHKVAPEVPTALSVIVARAMAKKPADRYRSAREMSHDLRAWLEANVQADDEPEPDLEEEPGKRWWMIGAGALVVGAGVLWLLPPRTATESLVAKAPAGAASANMASPPAPAPASAVVVAAPPTAAAASAASAPDETASVPAQAASGAAPKTPVAISPSRPASATASKALPALNAASAPKAAERPPKPVKPPVAEPAPTPTVAAAPTTGVVHFAVSPWGTVEVDGRSVGVAPPLTQLSLPEGDHTITIRNDDSPARTVTVTVTGGQSVTVKQRF